MEKQPSSTTIFGNASKPLTGSGTMFSLPFLILTVLFVVCLIVANLVEIKTVSLGFMTVTAGLVVFPLSYIINDCIVEVYGFRKARIAIWLGFAMSLLVTIMLNIAIWLPGDEGWRSQEAMEAVYGSVPRIMLASFAAFLSGSLANAYVMARMKGNEDTSEGFNRRFSVRAIVSTIWGEGVDSVIFFPIAFGGTLPWPTIISLILTQTFLKTFYEIMILPLTITIVRRLKRIDRSVSAVA